MNAAEVRKIASNYDKDYCAMPEGVELWGTREGDWWLTGTNWFLLRENTVLSSQYQPPCDSEKEAKRDRTCWIILEMSNELMRAGKGL